MKELLKSILGNLDWKDLLYGVWLDSLKPKLNDLVADTESKWDDIAVSSLEILIDKFLKPDAAPSLPPAA